MPGWWRRWLERRFGEDAETLRGRYDRFRHLIEGNNRVLELIADAGEKSGGDYLFDMRYLNWLVNELEKGVEGVVYDLNAMADGRYIELVEVFERIRQEVRSILSPSVLAESELVIPLNEVHLDLAGAVGGKMATIGELRNKFGLLVPDGFVVSASACRRHFQSEDVAQVIAVQSEALKEDGDAKVEQVAERLQEAVKRTPLPREVARAIRTEIRRPDRSDWTYAVRSSALGEDGEHSFAGQHETLLNVEPSNTVDAYRQVLASLFSERGIRYRAAMGIPVNDALMAVGFLAMVPARASGVVHTVDPSAPQIDRIAISAAHGLGPTVVEGSGPVDRFELTRDPTPRILSRRVARKESSILPREGGGTKAFPIPADDQDRPCISDEELIELGRIALRIERHAGRHQEIEWAVDKEGRIVILQARTLRVASFRARGDDNLAQVIAKKPVLLRGKGVIACRGVGAGPIVAVRSAQDFRAFPHGGVLFVQSASPQYSPLLARASAVITRVGSSTGHLAAVAREFRVPMLVDLRESTEVLTHGIDVTVDAEENVIYEGIVHELLRYHLAGPRTDAEFEEFRILRRLLRRITPLNLTDPESEGFRARLCTTYHDVIRFAHEMSVHELVDLPGLTTKDRKRFIRRLQLNIPMDLDVLSLGGGLEKGQDEGTIERDQLQCEPLVILLRGLCAPGTWRTEPVDMDMESLLSSATRAASVAVTHTTPVRSNLAVVSDDYLNLHLLLGYHFNMVDCRLTNIASANYIYFRFTGGVTDMTRRSRRARVIAAILEEFEFGVDAKGDLVIGRFRNAEPEPMRRRLEMLGRLIGFTRQLDVVMRNDETVHEHIREFIGHEPLSIDGFTFSETAGDR